MSLSATPTGSSMKRRFLFLASVIVLVAVGWSFFWQYAAGEVDRVVAGKVEDAGQRGLAISCPGRRVGGYPFRMEIHCDGFDLESPESGKLAMGPLRAVALIYDPRHVLIESDGPLNATVGLSGVTLSALWSGARASLRARSDRLAASALSVQDMNISLSGLFGASGPIGAQHVEAERAEFHLRESPSIANAADIALTLDRLSLAGLFQSAEPIDAAVLLYVPDASDLLSGNTERFLKDTISNARPIDVSEARLVLGDTQLTAQGSLHIQPTGTLSGELDVTVVEPNNLARLLTPLYPRDSTIPTAFQGVLNGLGTRLEIDGRPAIKARLRIVEGQVRVGLVPIAQIPPLF